MAQVYFNTQRHHEPAVFDYFFRKLPFKGGFVVFAGLSSLLDELESLHFSEEDIHYLRDIGFQDKFLEYLKDFRFRGQIYSSQEGDIVFPTRPVLRVEAGLLEAQLIETLLLNYLNFQSLVATKAARMRMVAGNRILSEFGLRRAQGPGGLHASRAAIIGGFNSTSNVMAAQRYQIQVNGTMAHSFIQGYENELDAFRAYAKDHPDKCTLLVDTYNTLESGVPNAIKVGLEMKAQGEELQAIRLDSGDLAYLSKKSRNMLDQAGLKEVKIVASNQLDEYVIRSLILQNAPIDIFGVGTSLVTGAPDAALDGVYKLASLSGKPRIKLSESIKKVTLPDQKQVMRMLDEEGNFYGADAVVLLHEKKVDTMRDPSEPQKSLSLQKFTQVPQLQLVMENGRSVKERESIQETAAYCQKRLHQLPEEFKRFDNPHIYKIGISPELNALRSSMINQHKES
jgi:nicotinate phosphoribosyltransferase